jgi:translation initiation factor IF-3
VERSHLRTRLTRVHGSSALPPGLGSVGCGAGHARAAGTKESSCLLVGCTPGAHGKPCHQHPPNKEQRISDPRTNDKIRVPEVRLVGPAGEQVGVVPIEVAQRLAQEADLDLVEVAPNSRPPVVKIMDYGKFKYENAQKAKEARRNQANTVLKEIRFRLKIDDHDYETKRKRAEGFLKAGDKVKAMILFRGREQSRPDQGVRLLRRFAEDIHEFGSVESNPTIDGRNMVMVIGPLKSKVDAKAEQNARRAAARTTPASTDAGDAPAAEAAPKEQ